jgi:hypothetical protein
MIAPPRTTERLLAGLGAKPAFRDALLGDLAEEFASRVETDGIERATRWYRREAVRAVPHLLRSWAHGVRLGDIGHLLGVIATAYTGMAVIALIFAGVFAGVVRTLGYQGQLLPRSSLVVPAVLSSVLLLGGVFSALGGYLAAWLDSRAPLVTATAFGTLLLLFASVAPHVIVGPVPSRFPGWYLAAVPIVEFLGTIMGGILRVRASERANVAA